jgi:hypothetical protein
LFLGDQNTCVDIVCHLYLHDVHKPMSRTAIINLRVSPELKEAAIKAADRENRSLTNWIEVQMVAAILRAENAGQEKPKGKLKK